MLPLGSLPALRRLLDCVTDGKDELQVDRSSILDEFRAEFDSIYSAQHSFYMAIEPILAVRQLLGALDGVVNEAFTSMLDFGRQRQLCGIHSIPDEILLRIIRLTLEPKYGGSIAQSSHLAISLSHVSSRFRGILLDIPHIWTTVSTSFPLDKLQALLSRSKSLPLDVTFSASKQETARIGWRRSAAQVIDALYRHSNRWKAINEPSKELWQMLTSKYPTAELGNLEVVRLFHPPGIPFAWHAPRLRKVHYHFTINEPLNPFVKELTNGVVAVVSQEAVVKHFEMVCQSPALSTFILGMVNSAHPDPAYIQAHPHCTLSYLKVLDLHFEFGAEWASLLAIMDMPSLETLKCVMDEKHDDQSRGFEPFVRLWNSSTVVYPKLKKFMMQYIRKEDFSLRPADSGELGDPMDLLDGLLRRMPSLRFFDVCAAPLKPLGYDFISGHSTVNPFDAGPRLEEVTYEMCPLVGEGYLRGLAEAFKQSSCWATLKKLTISPKSFSDEQLYTNQFKEELKEIYGERFKWLTLF